MAFLVGYAVIVSFMLPIGLVISMWEVKQEEKADKKGGKLNA